MQLEQKTNLNNGWSCRQMFEAIRELERAYPNKPATASPFQGLAIVSRQIAWGPKRMDDAWYALEAMHTEVGPTALWFE